MAVVDPISGGSGAGGDAASHLIPVDIGCDVVLNGRLTTFATRLYVEQLFSIDITLQNTGGFVALPLFGALDTGTITLLCLAPQGSGLEVCVNGDDMTAGVISVSSGGILLLADYEGVTGVVPQVATAAFTHITGFVGGFSV